MSQAGWRKWHRWGGAVAAPFLLFAAVTGVLAGVAEMTSDDEEAREKARERVSPVTLPAPPAAVADPAARALAAAAADHPAAPVDRVVIDLKADPPTVAVYLGKPGGGEDRRLVYDARTGQLLRTDPYAEKPFLTRLHSGEAFGDGGLMMSFVWGLVLVGLVVSGVVIYLAMRRPGATGWRRVFW